MFTNNEHLNFMNNKEIINKAINQFHKETDLNIIPLFNKRETEVELIDKDIHIKFQAEVKNFINKGMLGLLKNQLDQFKNIPILITTYLNPELAETIRKLEINYLDTAGNAFIKEWPLYIDIRGKKLEKGDIPKNIIGRAFQPAGLQIIYALLCNPNLEKNNYREIADLTNTGLGTVQIAFKDLERQGYIIDLGKQGKKIINKEGLMKKWVLQYPDKLKPKYFFGRYTKDENFNLENLDIRKFGGLWGGETAAAKLTNYLKPFIHTIYIGGKVGEFIIKNRLRKNQNGNIEIVKKFWEFTEDNDIVNPILVYADLLATGDPRNIETADILYEKEIAQNIK